MRIQLVFVFALFVLQLGHSQFSNGTSYPVLNSLGKASDKGMIYSKSVHQLSLRGPAIMPLGDSITAGMGDDSPPDLIAYRASLFNYLNFDFHFVGSNINGPPDLPYPQNEGHSGFRIDQLRASIDHWIGLNPPDIVLLQIGTNDIWQGQDAGAEIRLADLIARIHEDAPAAIIVVAQIPPMNNGTGFKVRVNVFNQHISKLVEGLQAEHQKVYLADLNSILDSNLGSVDLSADMVHPRQVGYAKMGRRWAETLNKLNDQGLIPNTCPRSPFKPASLVTF